MKKEKSKIALAAKVIGGSILLFVFVMNIMVFAKKDPVTGNLSLTALSIVFCFGSNVFEHPYVKSKRILGISLFIYSC